MSGLNPSLVCHTLNVEPGAKPVIQARRNYHKEDEVQIKQEIKKLLACGFIKSVKHPTWLANIVPVKKKNGQVRICIDYRDLNKACPKDEFPLPNMDMLIDSTSGQGMLSFMDGFSGYYQIKMATRDAEKTAFRTPYRNFHYTVMPFGLKNTGATYQRAMTAIFHDMMRKEVEDYVDDLVVKSKTRGEHWSILRKVLKRCRAYIVKLNPKKFSFKVSIGKFLGFVVHNRGIDVDPDKARAIASTASPSNQKQLKSFLGRLSYIRHFIPGLSAVIRTFTPLLKKGTKFSWTGECKRAYEKVQQLVTKLPTIKAPIPGIPLKLCLATTDTAVGTPLTQDDENGEEHPVYYVSRLLGEAEARYPKTEKICLALGLDFVGKINPASEGCVKIITAIEFSTKWVEAIPLRKAPGVVVCNFIREYIICMHGVPYKIVTDNGTPFVNREVSDMLKGYGVKHRKSTPVGAPTSQMRYGLTIHHAEQPRVSPPNGSEAISPVELTVPTTRVLTVNDLEWDASSCFDWRLMDLEAADEQRQQVEENMKAYHEKVTQAYNRTVKERCFKEGDLVLKTADWVRKQVSGPSKFAPQWEGPFVVKKSHSSGYYVLTSITGGAHISPINGKWLKLYYC
ncbi:hypothetical protein ACLB2K_041565 [Fragaria x ananassa]